MDSNDAENGPTIVKVVDKPVGEGDGSIDLPNFSQTTTLDAKTGQPLWGDEYFGLTPEQIEYSEWHKEHKLVVPPIIVEGHETISEAEAGENVKWLESNTRGLAPSSRDVLLRIFKDRFAQCTDRQRLQSLMVAVDQDVKTVLAESASSRLPLASKDREEANAKLIETYNDLLKKDEDGKALIRWVADGINKTYHLAHDRVVPSDLKSLKIAFAESPTASLVVGAKVVRPALLLDRKGYATVRKKMFPDHIGLPAAHCGHLDDDGTMGEYSMIAQSGGWVMSRVEDSEPLGHEILHTTDPLIRRMGYDRILEEVYAQLPFASTKEELVKHISDEGYYENYKQEEKKNQQLYSENRSGKSTGLINKIQTHSNLGYLSVCSQVADTALARIEEIGFIATMRELASTNSVDEYIGKITSERAKEIAYETT